ncbi:Tn3 family transposase, partial [Ruegeria sp.]|uniref:Tn3 family transposase n=1 Tax=Ruegeria sp. TaxID=1879320 RepID=UPI003B007E59
MSEVRNAGAVMRTLQVRERTTALAKALGELGKIIKSLHILRFITDEETRRRILIQLNRQELRHSLARRV